MGVELDESSNIIDNAVKLSPIIMMNYLNHAFLGKIYDKCSSFSQSEIYYPTISRSKTDIFQVYVCYARFIYCVGDVPDRCLRTNRRVWTINKLCGVHCAATVNIVVFSSSNIYWTHNINKKYLETLYTKDDELI